MPFLFFQLSIKRNPESSRLGLDLLNLMLAQFQFIIRQSLAKYSEYAPEVVFIQSEISHSQLLHRPISAKYHASIYMSCRQIPLSQKPHKQICHTKYHAAKYLRASPILVLFSHDRDFQCRSHYIDIVLLTILQ